MRWSPSSGRSSTKSSQRTIVKKTIKLVSHTLCIIYTSREFMTIWSQDKSFWNDPIIILKKIAIEVRFFPRKNHFMDLMERFVLIIEVEDVFFKWSYLLTIHLIVYFFALTFFVNWFIQLKQFNVIPITILGVFVLFSIVCAYIFVIICDI